MAKTQDPYAPKQAADPYAGTRVRNIGEDYRVGDGNADGSSHRDITATYAGDQAPHDAYRSNMATNFQGAYDNQVNGRSSYTSYGDDADPEVRAAQEAQNQLSDARTGSRSGDGVDQVATQARLDALKAHIAQRNALGEKINSSDTQEASAENDIRSTANQALSSGLKNTRENYNGRGLLYSGMRQGGEGKVRNAVAGQMAEGMAGTKRDFTNSKEQAKLAYSAIGAAAQKERFDQANQTFDMVTKNNVARMQAMQQLGEGTGRLAMTFAGGNSANKGTQNAQSQVGSNDYQFLGTGARDGYGGEQLSAGNPDYDYGRRTS